MNDNPFTLSVLQAINDWQRGGDTKQVVRRGEALKRECATLPNAYRFCSSTCYRQIALQKGSIWNLVVKAALAEKISSWTLSTEVAEGFKGGVPPEGQGYWGVIFSYMPSPANVIVNLDLVYRDQRFIQACIDRRLDIVSYGDGIGAWGNTQSEIVLEVPELQQRHLYSFGGHSSSFDDLVLRTAHLIYRRAPTPDELQRLRLAVEHVRAYAGPAWLSHDATQRVLNKLAPHAELLSTIKQLQEAMKVADHC